MSREKLKKEAEEWLNKWELCNKCENKVNCISNFSYCKKVVLQSYLASAEPREKQIAELKADNDARKFAMAMSEKVERQLRNERNTFLAQNEQYEKDLIDLKENLTKAKEIIKLLLWDLRNHSYNPEKDMARAEEFLGRNK